jgi:hypothetical protein
VTFVGSRGGCCADRIFCGPSRTSSSRTLLLTTCISLWDAAGGQDSSARYAPRREFWNPERLSPKGLAAPRSSEPPRPVGHEATGRFRHAFHALRCAPGTPRPHDLTYRMPPIRLLSIERARSTPRTTANPEAGTGQCRRQAIDRDRSAGSRPSRGEAPVRAQHPRLDDRSSWRIYPCWVVVRTPHVARRCPEPLEERPGRRCGCRLVRITWPSCSTHRAELRGTPAVPRRETRRGKRFPGCLRPARSVRMCAFWTASACRPRPERPS